MLTHLFDCGYKIILIINYLLLNLSKFDMSNNKVFFKKIIVFKNYFKIFLSIFLCN